MNNLDNDGFGIGLPFEDSSNIPVFKKDDLEFLKYFSDIRYLCLRSFDFKEINHTFLQGFDNLSWLELNLESDSLNFDISFLENLKSLNCLLIHGLGIKKNNTIYHRNLYPLQNLNKLLALRLDDLNLNLNNLDFLNKDLLCLSLRTSKINDLSFLENLNNLKLLELIDCNINDITNLKNLKNIFKLDLSENMITDISPLENLVNLEYLYMSKNNIQSIDVVSNFKKLKSISLSYSTEHHIDILKTLPNLKNVFLYKPSIDNIEILDDLNIELLQIIGRNITENELEKIFNFHNSKEILINYNDYYHTLTLPIQDVSIIDKIKNFKPYE